MKTKIIPAAIAAFAIFVQALAWTQPVAQRTSDARKSPNESSQSSREESAQEEYPASQPRPARMGKRPNGKKGVSSGVDKQAIESYLQSRLAQLSKFYRAQQKFGQRFSHDWESFWTKVFKERKLFEVRIARQRLDLFESLGSLDPGAHAAAIADYERLQSNVMKSFEDAQKQKVAEFFAQMAGELKDFSAEQERQRQDFMARATDAWQAQKTGTP